MEVWQNLQEEIRRQEEMVLNRAGTHREHRFVKDISSEVNSREVSKERLTSSIGTTS